MSFQDFLNYIGWKATTFWGVLIFLMTIGIEIIPKIKWNPWSTLIRWIGSRFNSKIDANIDAKIALVRKEIKEVDNKIESVQNDLTKHVEESEVKALQDTRRDIIASTHESNTILLLDNAMITKNISKTIIAFILMQK